MQRAAAEDGPMQSRVTSFVAWSQVKYGLCIMAALQGASTELTSDSPVWILGVKHEPRSADAAADGAACCAQVSSSADSCSFSLEQQARCVNRSKETAISNVKYSCVCEPRSMIPTSRLLQISNRACG